MPSHSDRLETQQSAKSDPSLRGWRRKPFGQRCVAPARPCATRLAEKFPASITGCQIGRKVLFGWCYGYLVAKIATFVIIARCLLAARRLR